VAGSTDYDFHDAALSAILAEWNRIDIAYATRLAECNRQSQIPVR